jgi:GDP-L-fucose synthase
MVGSAIVRKLEEQGFKNIVARTSAELDLRSQQAVEDFFAKEKLLKESGFAVKNQYE